MFPTIIKQYHSNTVEEVFKSIEPYLESIWSDPQALMTDAFSSKTGYVFCQENYNDGNGIHTLSETVPLIDELETMLQDYWNHSEFNQEFKPKVVFMTAFKQVEFGGKVHKHEHDEFMITGCVYPYVKNKHTLIFENPVFPAWPTEEGSVANPTYEISLTTGTVVIWPGIIKHTIISETIDDWTGGATRIGFPFFVKVERK
jgi:hypothetical protein